MGALITTAARLARQSLRPIFLSPSPYAPYKFIYDLMATLISLFVLNYATGPFMVSTWDKSLELCRILKWYGHVVVLGSLVFLWCGGGMWVRRLMVKVD